MARNCRIQALRTTRAALDSNAGSNNLFAGEFYWITDEDILAVGKAVNTYVDIGPGLQAGDNETITGAWTFDGNLIFGGGVDHTPGSGQLLRLWDDTTTAFVNVTVDADGDLGLGNYLLDVDQTVGAGQDGYVLTYDDATGLIGLEAASGGISAVVDDTTPELGGALNVNGNDIIMGFNHLICSQRIAEHSGDTDTYMEFDGSNQWSLTLGGTQILDASSSGLTVNSNLQLLTNSVLVNEEIARHNADFDTHIDFPASDQWSVTVGGTEMLEVGTSGVDIDGYCRYRANVISITSSGTTAIGSTTTGNTYYDTHSTGTRFFRLDSATVGTQIEVHKNGAGTTTFSQGTSQTIIQGTSVNLKDKSAMVAKCVATNTWSVVGGAA